MKTRMIFNLCVVAAICLVPIVPVGAETVTETKVSSRIDSVALFKNGLVVVKETIPISEPGTYLLEDVPRTVLGTFFIESDYPVETVVKTRVIASTPNESSGAEYWQQLQDKDVRIVTIDGTALTGQLIYSGLDSPKSDTINSLLDSPTDTSMRHSPSYYFSPNSDMNVPRSYLVLRDEEARTVFIESSRIATIETTEKVANMKTVPVMIFEVGEKPSGTVEGSISLFYLTKGMSWAPSYRIDISDPKTLTIEQNAILVNELMAVENAEISLISGFPRVEFEQTLSLMTPDTTLLSFFNQLAGAGRVPGSSHIMTQQAITSNFAMPTASMPEVNSQQLAANEGPDTYYHSIGPRTLDRGSRRSLLVAKKSAEYERMMECKIPAFAFDPQQNYNTPPQTAYRKGEISEVWEVLRFKNPFDFPMTTGPATVTGHGRFLGQNSAYWTGSGAELTVPVTRAMSVQVISDEEERGGSIEPWQIIDPDGTTVQNTEKRPPLYRFYRSGSTYRKQEIDAKLTIKNLRTEPMKILITRHISGEFLKANRQPETKILVERDSHNVNRSHELKWELELPPGETMEIDFSYERFVPY